MSFFCIVKNIDFNTNAVNLQRTSEITDKVEEFYSKLVGSSTNAKIEAIFKNVDYYHYQFIHAKRRLDLFRKMPFLDLLLTGKGRHVIIR